MVSSFFRNKNSLIRVGDEKPNQIRIVIEEVEGRRRSNVIDLNDWDENDKIPLRQMMSRARIFKAAPLFNPTPISLIEPRLDLGEKDLEDGEFLMDVPCFNPVPV